MEYRTIYIDDRVIESVINDSNSITHSNEKFIIDTIPNTITLLSSNGVNISYFWKNGLTPRKTENGYPLIDISNHPVDDNVKRKVMVDSFFVDYDNHILQFNLVIKHYINGEYSYDPYNDEWKGSEITNLTEIEGTPEFDYFYNLLNTGIPLGPLQAVHVGLMDNESKFNDIY